MHAWRAYGHHQVPEARIQREIDRLDHR